MNVGRVHNIPIFTVCTPRDECWGGVHPSIIHCVLYTPCRGVHTPRDECWRGVHPFNIHHVPLYLVEWSIPLAMNI